MALIRSLWDWLSDTFDRIGAPAGASISADVAAVKTDTGNIATRLGTPAAGTVAGDVESVETKVDDLDGDVVAVAALVHARVMGRLQIATKSWDGRVGSGAGSDALLTATTQAVVVEAVIVVMAAAPDLTDDPWTGISIEDDYGTTPHIFIAAADGVKANLTANAQLAWTGSVYLAAGQVIQATAIGNDADADAGITVIALYRAVVSGGYLT